MPSPLPLWAACAFSSSVSSHPQGSACSSKRKWTTRNQETWFSPPSPWFPDYRAQPSHWGLSSWKAWDLPPSLPWSSPSHSSSSTDFIFPMTRNKEALWTSMKKSQKWICIKLLNPTSTKASPWRIGWKRGCALWIPHRRKRKTLLPNGQPWSWNHGCSESTISGNRKRRQCTCDRLHFWFVLSSAIRRYLIP